jgi:hypothetical protein
MKGALTEMATKKDMDFLSFLIDQTRGHRIKWEPSAEPDQFVVGLKGKYKAQVDKYENGKHILRLFDDADREMLALEDYETDNRTGVLYDLAVRNSLDVDRAIDEIMTEPPITDEDIPF